MEIIFVIILGILSYFEPCTIATHTLLAAYSHQARGWNRWRPILSMWGTRTILILALAMLFQWRLAPVEWNPFATTAALLFLAIIYIISRFQYIPIPHLEFYRGLPGGKKLPPSIQLGLTLPACTLPLVVIVIGITLSRNSYGFATLIAALYGSFFSLPVAVLTITGLTASVRGTLTFLANTTPFITAIFILLLIFIF